MPTKVIMILFLPSSNNLCSVGCLQDYDEIGPYSRLILQPRPAQMDVILACPVTIFQ